METDAWVFLDIANPVCAWAAYRGVLVETPEIQGFISPRMASILRAGGSRLRLEMKLESERQAHFPSEVSRLSGMYCFTDLRSAELALQWNGRHFRPECFAELSLIEATRTSGRLDSNWITYAADPLTAGDWSWRYWSGEPYPCREPVWETLVRGRALVLGTEIREQAYKIIKAAFPTCLVLLETARLAAWIGRDLGNVAAIGFDKGDHVRVDYLIDMREAADPTMLSALDELRESGHPINWADIGPLIPTGAFITPNFEPLGFSFSKAPLLGPVSSGLKS